MILVGDGSLYISTIEVLTGTDAILQGCQATPNTVIYGVAKLRSRMKLMLLDQGDQQLYCFEGYLKMLEPHQWLLSGHPEPPLCFASITTVGLQVVT